LLNYNPYKVDMKQSLQLAYIDWCIQQARARSENYRVFREYYDGIQDVKMIDRLKSFLDTKADLDFTVNYVPMVVQARASRLIVTGFETEDDSDKTYDEWWQKNRMDALSNIVHLCAVRDADTYLLCEWDSEAQMPRYYHENAYSSGEGVSVYYSDERKTEIKFASKHWITQYGENTGKQGFLYLYFPNRIERYISNDDVADGSYQPYVPDNDETVFIGDGAYGKAGISWWTDTGLEDGKPLGVPIFHFKDNDSGDRYGNALLGRIVPLQDALNKAMIDLIAMMDSEGFGVLFGSGGTFANARIGPGMIAYDANPDAKLDRIAASNPAGMLAVYNALVMEIARVSGTPLSYLQSSGQVAAEGTMKQQETALVSYLKKAQVDFGNVWEDALVMGRKLFNAFGRGGLNPDTIISTIWQDAESRNEDVEIANAAIKVEKLGIPASQVQLELGYTPEQIAKFAVEAKRKETENQRNQLALLKAKGNNQDEANAQNNNQSTNEAQNGNGTRASP
jgi:hypothetical protein